MIETAVLLDLRGVWRVGGGGVTGIEVLWEGGANICQGGVVTKLGEILKALLTLQRDDFFFKSDFFCMYCRGHQQDNMSFLWDGIHSVLAA